MDSFEFNKIAMAVLGTAFLVMGLNFASDGIFHSEAPETKGFAIEVAEADNHGEAAEAASTGPEFEPISVLLASADAGAGEKVAKKCAACHKFDEGGKNGIGPALYGIVNRDIASAEGFSYSGAMKDFGASKQWTYEELNGFLWKPKTYLKGTAMSFGGIKKVEDRAALVAYLRTLSASPAALPAQ